VSTANLCTRRPATRTPYPPPVPAVQAVIADLASSVNRSPDLASTDLVAAIAARLDVPATQDFARAAQHDGLTVRPYNHDGVRVTIDQPPANERLL